MMQMLDDRSKHFNPRPSVRGDASAASAERSISPFQSTPLREGRQQMFPDFLDSVYMRSSQNSQPNSDTPDMNSRKER